MSVNGTGTHGLGCDIAGYDSGIAERVGVLATRDVFETIETMGFELCATVRNVQVGVVERRLKLIWSGHSERVLDHTKCVCVASRAQISDLTLAISAAM